MVILFCIIFGLICVALFLFFTRGNNAKGRRIRDDNESLECLEGSIEDGRKSVDRAKQNNRESGKRNRDARKNIQSARAGITDAERILKDAKKRSSNK